VHTILSIKVYPIRREVALVILMFGVLLLLMAWIVSNALLGLR
jgi:predicted nucleic acid-binding Zn ribbon protein